MKISFAQGLAKAIYESLAGDPNVVLIGSGFMGLNSAARAMLEPALKDFADRILVTPISELALAGAGIGAAMCGQRPLVDLSTGSFIFEAFPQVVNEAANIHYMTGGQTSVPVPRSTRIAPTRCSARRPACRSSSPQRLTMPIT